MEPNREGFPKEFRPQKVKLTNAAELAERPPAEIAVYFHDNPSVARQLYLESGDKRYTPSTYIDGSYKVYRVGWFSSDFKRKNEIAFDNLADAATDYLLFSLGKSRWMPNKAKSVKEGFLIRNNGATEEAIRSLASTLPNGLGTDLIYLAFLRKSNGATGDLAIEPRNVVLWRAEELVERNAEYKVADLAPGLFAFGSDGGTKLLAFDMRGSQPWPIVVMAMAPISVQNATQIAPDFISLIGALGQTFVEPVD